jgi:hypothetical protein
VQGCAFDDARQNRSVLSILRVTSSSRNVVAFTNRKHSEIHAKCIDIYDIQMVSLNAVRPVGALCRYQATYDVLLAVNI